jgi:murein L,D-transpeptidase YafK
MKEITIGSLLFTIVLCLTSSASAKNWITPQEWEKATEATVASYEHQVNAHLIPLFKKAHVAYPPAKVALLTFKKERTMELWAKNTIGHWHFIKRYRLQAMSGHPGPKLHRRDDQIPEGIYKIIEFNPYSHLHLSLELNYPNAFDRYFAKHDGRRDLGGNIFIHGKNLSVGCLAIGDHAINELFVLLYRVGRKHATVIIAPNDLRRERPANLGYDNPRWVPILDKIIRKALRPFSVKEDSVS